MHIWGLPHEVLIIYFFSILLIIIVVYFRSLLKRIARTLIGVVSFFMGRKARSTMKIFWFLKPPLIEIQTYEEIIDKIKGSKRILNIHDVLPMVETGDIFTFVGRIQKPYQMAIKWFTASPVSHVGICYKDDDEQLFLIEADHIGFNKVDLHRIIHKYSRRFPLMIYRKLEVERNEKFHQNFKEFMEEYKDTPYTPMKTKEGLIELIKSAVDIRIPLFKTDIFHNKEERNSLFCSELVAIAFSYLGLLEIDEYIPSNEYTPADFSKINENIQWGPERERLKNLMNGAKLAEELFVHPEEDEDEKLNLNTIEIP